MADFARLAVVRLLQDRSVAPVLERDFTPAMLYDDESEAVLQYVLDHYGQYRAVPSAQLVAAQFPKYTLEPAPDTLAFYLDHLMTMHVRAKAVESVLAAGASLADPSTARAAVASLRKTFVALSATGNGQKDTKVDVNTADRVAAYQFRKTNTGIVGITTGWDTLDDLTEGLQPEMYVGIAARPGKGKTHFLIRMAQAAYRDGRKVLFANKELSTDLMDRRFDAHWFSLNFERFRKGMLTTGEEQRYTNGMVDLQANPPGEWTWLHNVQNVSGIAAKVEQHQPDILFVDGAYLLLDDDRGKQRWERYENISRGLKRLAQDYKIAVVMSIQLSRTGDSAKWNREPTLSDIMGADAFAQDVDFLFALEQSPEMARANEMKLLPLKCREAAPIPILLGWDFATMQFPDLGVATQIVAAPAPTRRTTSSPAGRAAAPRSAVPAPTRATPSMLAHVPTIVATI